MPTDNPQQKKVVFFVQAEGRGHMTQALTAKKIFHKHSFEIMAVFCKDSGENPVPGYFRKEFDGKLFSIKSPSLYPDKAKRGVSLWLSFFLNLLKIPTYFFGLRDIHKTLHQLKPDLIVNFHEPICGTYSFFYSFPCPVISIAHQYIYFHLQFRFENISWFQQKALILINKLAVRGSDMIAALNFNRLESAKVTVLPPLIDIELLRQSKSIRNDITAYFLYPGFDAEVTSWKNKFPCLNMQVFRPGEDHSSHAGLEFHSIDRDKFISCLKGTNYFIGTAGFESLCESVWLGATVYCMPVPNHAEQYINSTEFFNSGLGYKGTNLPTEMPPVTADSNATNVFREWVSESDRRLMAMVNKALLQAND